MRRSIDGRFCDPNCDRMVIVNLSKPEVYPYASLIHGYHTVSRRDIELAIKVLNKYLTYYPKG